MPLNDRTQSGTPTADLPEVQGKVRALRQGEIPATLAGRLIPIVDKIRQLNTAFGIRPYRVFLTHTIWSGGGPGEGSIVVQSSREVLPTPRIRDMNSTSNVMRSIGLSEEGELSVDQISARYTEDDLQGLTPDLADPALPRTDLDYAEFYWEVVENRPSCPSPVRRRYVPSAVPMLSRDGFQWSVRLTKQDYNRGRRGGTFRESND